MFGVKLDAVPDDPVAICREQQMAKLKNIRMQDTCMRVYESVYRDYGGECSSFHSVR